MIPPLTTQGLLPEGVFEATLSEIAMAFANNSIRRDLFMHLEKYLRDFTGSRYIRELYIDGSFVTDKKSPGDIDVFMFLDQSEYLDLINQSPHELAFLHNQFCRQEYSLDLYFKVRTNVTMSMQNNNDFVQYFQYIGVKTGLIKNLDPKHKKGIIKVIL